MCYVTQCNTAKFVKKLLGEKFVETVLQRLDRLMQDETRMTTAETLKVVYGLVQEMSEKTYARCHLLVVEHLSCQMERHLMMVSGKLSVGIVTDNISFLCLIQLRSRNAA